MKKTVFYTRLKGIMFNAFCLVAVCSISARAQIISTAVGSGVSGHSGDGGAATLARVKNPAGIAFNGTTMVVSDYSGNYIRQVVAGTITTIAGTGTGSSTGDGAAATLATLKNPAGLAYDASGNLYIAEAGGHRIRKISTSGTITTYAGTGSSSGTVGDGGDATSAVLNTPTDIVFDASGDLYISENNGHRVRKVVTSTGKISTVAGTGTAGTSGDGGTANAAKINSPAGLAFDSDGNLYIAENAGHVIRMVNTSGDISTVAGTGTAGTSGDGAAATSAKIQNPRGLAIDAADNLFISEENGYVVRKVNSVSKNISTIAGTGTFGYSGDGGAATSATFKTPYGIALGSGNLYIVDLGSYVVRKICNAPVPTGSTTVPLCQNSTASALTMTGTNLKWYANEADVVGSVTAPVPVTTTVGTKEYWVTQTPTTFACESPKTKITVVINPTPVAPAVTAAVPYCEGSVATALTASKPSSTDVLNWYTVATGGTASATAPTPLTDVSHTEYFYVSATSDLGCEGPRSMITVTVNDTPTTPGVTTPVVYCEGETAVALTASKPSPSDNLYWYTVATGGTGTTVAPVPATTTAGSYLHYVSAKTTAGCEGARSLITVTVNPTPGAPAVTTPLNYCEGESAAVLTAAVTGTDVLQWYTVPTAGTASTTAITPGTATTGTATYYVSAKTTLGCEGPRSAIVVNTNAIPGAPTVSSTINLCKDVPAAALTASSSASSDVFYWYNSAIGGTGSTTAPVPNTTATGTRLYYVSAKSAAGCEGDRAVITVIVNDLPAAPTVTTPLNYCFEATTAVALTASAGATDTLYWYADATGGTGSTTAPTPLTTTVGSKPFYVSAKNVVGCESKRTTLTVHTRPLADKPVVVTPVTYCKDASAVALTAKKGASTDVLQWYEVAVGGTASTTAPIPSTTATGSTSYYVSAESAYGCEGEREMIVVNVDPLPAAPTFTSPVVFCEGVPATALTATTGSTSDTLYWYTTAIGGTGTKTAPTPSTASAGTKNYYVSAKNSLGCEGDRQTITVEVNAAPAAPKVTTPVNYCEGAPAVALEADGTNLLWYADATGGTGSATATIPATTAAGTKDYYVTQTPVAGECESPRAKITVVVNPLPAVPEVKSPVNLCDGATPVAALTAKKAKSDDTLYWYTTATGGTGSITAPTPSTAGASVTKHYVSIKTVFGCEGPRDSITVEVHALPSTPVVSSPVVYCQHIPATALTATGDNLKWYTVATGGTGSTTAPVPSTTADGSKTYYVSQSLDAASGACESHLDSIIVNVNKAPAAPVTGTLNLCQGGPADTLLPVGTHIRWYDAATGGAELPLAPSLSTATDGTFRYYVTQTSDAADGSCESLRGTYVVRVRKLPEAPTVVTPVNLCEGGAGTTLTATGDNLKWYTAATGGTGSTTAPVITTGATGVERYFVSASLAAASGGCEGSRTEITAVINALPPAPTVTSPVNLCLRATPTALTATGTNLLWYVAATGGMGSTTPPMPSTAVEGSTDYYVSQVSDASTGSCEGSRTLITATVQPLPVVTIDAPSGVIFCPGLTVPLKAIAPTALKYQWEVLGSPIPGEIRDTYNAGTTGLIGVEVTDMYNCKGKADIFVEKDPSKKPTLSPVAATICAESSTLLTCNPGFTTYSFRWLKNGSDLTPITTKVNVKTVSAPGTYTVIVTNDYGCLDTTNDAVITNYPAPPKPIINDGSAPRLSVPTTYRYYQWYLDGVAIPGANNFTYIATKNGDYHVVVTDENGCTNVSDDVAVTNVSINNVIAKTELKLYPNPTRDRITIEAPVPVNVRVLDLVGKVIFEGNDVHSVNLENQADGTYFFRISNENNQLISVEKITKSSK